MRLARFVSARDDRLACLHGSERIIVGLAGAVRAWGETADLGCAITP
jgi:hypothetical protein